MKENCIYCKFFLEFDDATKKFINISGGYEGKCRRFPANVKKMNYEWCGEYKPKENKYED